MKRRDWLISATGFGASVAVLGRPKVVAAQHETTVPGGPDDEYSPMPPPFPRVAPIATVVSGGRRLGSVALSVDGSRLAAAGEGEKGFRVWDAANGRMCLDSAEPPGQTSALAFAPDGMRIAAAAARGSIGPGDEGDPTLFRILDIDTGGDSRSLPVLQEYVKGLIWTRAGKVVALDTAEVIWAWNVADGSEAFTLAGPGGRWHGGCFELAQSGFGVSADGRRAVALSTDAEIEGVVRPERTINLYDGEAGTCRFLDAKAGPLRSVAISPDGSRVIAASTNEQILIFDFVTGGLAESFFPGPGGGGIGPYFLAFSPDGAYFLFGKKDGVLRMYRNEKSLGFIDQARGPRSFIRAVAFLPDRLRVVSGGIAKIGFKRHPNGVETWKYEPLWVWDVPYRRNPQGISFQHPKP